MVFDPMWTLYFVGAYLEKEWQPIKDFSWVCLQNTWKSRAVFVGPPEEYHTLGIMVKKDSEKGN